MRAELANSMSQACNAARHFAHDGTEEALCIRCPLRNVCAWHAVLFCCAAPGVLTFVRGRGDGALNQASCNEQPMCRSWRCALLCAVDVQTASATHQASQYIVLRTTRKQVHVPHTLLLATALRWALRSGVRKEDWQ